MLTAPMHSRMETFETRACPYGNIYRMEVTKRHARTVIEILGVQINKVTFEGF